MLTSPVAAGRAGSINVEGEVRARVTEGTTREAVAGAAAKAMAGLAKQLFTIFNQTATVSNVTLNGREGKWLTDGDEIGVCVCVCVCVSARAREREIEKEREHVRASSLMRPRVCLCVCVCVFVYVRVYAFAIV